MTRYTKTVPFHYKALDSPAPDVGILEGYASTFGNVDDVIEPGAFSETLNADIQRIKILSGHNEHGQLPIGKPIELREDSQGLYLKAQISDTTLGRDVRTLLRDGVLSELSIGYTTDPSDCEFDDRNIRHIRKLRLWEVSVVTWAMNPQAVIADYKAQDTPVTAVPYSLKPPESKGEPSMPPTKKAITTSQEAKALATTALEDALARLDAGDADQARAALKYAAAALKGKANKRKKADDEYEGEEDDETEDEKEDDETEEEKEDDEGEKEDDEEGEKEDGESDDAEDSKRKKKKSHAAPRHAKTAARSSRPAYTPPPAANVQRKYSDLYLGGSSSSVQVKQRAATPAVNLARLVKCSMAGRGDPNMAANYASKELGDPMMAREFKTLNTIAPTAGGFLIPESYSDEIIELLYNKTFLFELGVRRVAMATGTLTIPKMTSGSDAYWIGEARPIPKTEPKYGQIKMSAKKLAAIIRESSEIVFSSNFTNEERFGNDLMRKIQLRLEGSALYGTGGEFSPLGLSHMPDVDSIDLSALADPRFVNPDGSVTGSFISYVQARALQKNIDSGSLGWVMNVQAETMLLNAMNPGTLTVNYVYRDEMLTRHTLMGVPYKVTNLIPIDANGGTELFFANWSDMLVGDYRGLTVRTSDEASTVDDDGATVSNFQNDLVSVRAIAYMDIAVRHPESFLIVKNVKLPAYL